jgi:hypothetical protein
MFNIIGIMNCMALCKIMECGKALANICSSSHFNLVHKDHLFFSFSHLYNQCNLDFNQFIIFINIFLMHADEQLMSDTLGIVISSHCLR